MPHPVVDNATPFVFAPLFVADEDGRPVVVPLLKATYDVSPAGETSLAPEQRPVSFEGEPNGEPGGSYKFEPEVALPKPATDVVLVGHAHAPQVGAVWVDVDFRAGDLAKTVRVLGDRHVTGLLQNGISNPQPFETIPLVYERAFGGWDRSSENPEHHQFDPRNPVGVGFRAKHTVVAEGDALPNLEDPNDPLRSGTGTCSPAGFGFVGPDWAARSRYAGTYDDAWTKGRAPLLPRDFDRRFFNAASPGLVAPGYFAGNEGVHVRNATPQGTWAFWLPGVAPPQCLVATRFGSDMVAHLNLDTVIVDADAMQVVLLWRGLAKLRDGPLDVRAFKVSAEGIPATTAHTQAASTLVQE